MIPSSSKPQLPRIDVVIPVYNEELMVDSLISHLRATFDEGALRRHEIKSIHFHFIDDGSIDQTAAKIYAQITAGFPGTLHVLSRNFGHQAAVCAGLDASTADLVFIIDADLQDPPELLFEMLTRWRAGFDVIYGVRRKRQEFFLKRIAYKLFYKVLAFLSEIEIPVDAGDFCLVDRKIVEALRKLPEKLRFPRGLRAWVGFRQCGVPYDRPKRSLGSTKYPFLKLYRLATDGIASMSTRVLQATQLFTFLFAVVSFGISIYLASVLLSNSSRDPLFLWFMIGYLLNSIIGFVTLFALYILGAYVGRTYLETKDRPTYIVSERIGSSS